MFYGIKNRRLLEANLNDSLTKFKDEEDVEKRERLLSETKTMYDLRIREKKEDNDKWTKILETCEDLAGSGLVAGGTLLTTAMIMDFEKENIIPEKFVRMANRAVEAFKRCFKR